MYCFSILLVGRGGGGAVIIVGVLFQHTFGVILATYFTCFIPV